MVFTINPPNAPMVDPKTGIVDPVWYRFFANLQRVLGDDIVSALQDAPYITFDVTEVLRNEKVLAGSDNVTADVGSLQVVLDITDTGVTPNSYGSASAIPNFTVDEKGRLTFAGEDALDSDNVNEGATNLFFTSARSRAAVSDGSGIDYDTATGVISATPAGAYGTPTGALSRASFASYSAPVISNPPTQAEVQAVADALQVVSRTLAALITDLETNGNLS